MMGPFGGQATTSDAFRVHTPYRNNCDHKCCTGVCMRCLKCSLTVSAVLRVHSVRATPCFGTLGPRASRLIADLHHRLWLQVDTPEPTAEELADMRVRICVGMKRYFHGKNVEGLLSNSVSVF